MVTVSATISASIPAVTPSRSSRRLARDRPSRPVASAPRAKQPTAATEAVAEKPPTPASAKAKKTTFPVMLATNTCPRTR